MLKEIVLLLVRSDIRKRQTEFGIIILAEILDMVARRLLGNMAGKVKTCAGKAVLDIAFGLQGAF